MTLIVPPTIAGKYQSHLTASSKYLINSDTQAPGTENTKSLWRSIIDPTNKPSYGIYVSGIGGGGTAAGRRVLLDIGYGPTGGGNELVVVPNINLGLMRTRHLFFPIYIPAGVRVSFRAQGSVTYAYASILVWLAQDAPYPWACGPVQDYGTDLATSGGALVMSAYNAWGSWIQIAASTARPHRFWNVLHDCGGDTTAYGMETLIELGYGPNSSNVTTLFQNFIYEYSENGGLGPPLIYAPVPAGTPLFARIASGAANNRGVIAYGMD